jgi:hypothetical protein
MFGFTHAFIGVPGPNAVSNPDSVGTTGLLFRITLETEFVDGLTYLEEQFPGRVTLGPLGEYSGTGYTEAGPPPFGGMGSIAFSEVDPGIASLSCSQFIVARVRDVFIDGVSAGNVVQPNYAMNIMRADPEKIIKVSKIEIIGGYTYNYEEDPLSPESDGTFNGTAILSDFDATYIPLPGCIVNVYGVIVDDDTPIEPVDAVPGAIFPGYGVITEQGNYIHESLGRAWTYLTHPTQLQVEYTMLHEVHGIVGNAMVGQFLLTAAGVLQFTSETGITSPQVIATNVKSISPAYSLMKMSASLLDIDNMCAVFIVKNDNTVSWWATDSDPYISGIENIPANLVSGTETVRCIRYSGVKQITAVEAESSEGAIFGALTTAGDLYLWGRQAVELGFPSTPTNLAGAIDFVIVMLPTPHILFLTDQGFCFELEPDGTITARGGSVLQMHKRINDHSMVQFKRGDGTLDWGYNPEEATQFKDTSGTVTALISELLVTNLGKMERWYDTGGGVYQIDTRYSAVREPPGYTFGHIGRLVYDETDSPVPAKYRRNGGMGAGGVTNSAYIDSYGRVRRFLFNSLTESMIYLDSNATEGAVDFDKMNDRTTAVLDVYGDVYDGGSYLARMWDKVSMFPGVPIKGIFSARSEDTGNYVIGVGLDDKLVVPSDASYSLPAHQVDKVMRYMGKQSDLSGDYVGITVDGEIYFSQWNWSTGLPEHTGSDAIEFYPVQMPVLDPATQLPLTQTDGGIESGVVRNPDGTLSELPRASGGVMTNILAGLNISDVKKINARREDGFAVQLASDPKKLRFKSYAFNTGVGGIEKVRLTEWFDITLHTAPVDWWIYESQRIASDSFYFVIMFTTTNGSLWYYKVTWGNIDNESTFTVDNQLFIPAGESRTDIKTVGAPPVTGGWGLNWGNNFGGA